MVAIWHWFLEVTGTSNEAGKWYAFWSGFGADLEEFGIVVLVFGLYKRHKCQSCWRPALKAGLGRVAGTHYETCHRHTNKEEHAALSEQHRIRHPEMHEHLKGESAQ
jgi:hypothetical protein